MGHKRRDGGFKRQKDLIYSGGIVTGRGSSEEKKRFSRIGLTLFIMIALSTGLQIGLKALFGSPLSDSGEKSWVWFALRQGPLYFAAMPLGYLLLKSLPDGKIEKKRMEPKNYAILFFVCFFLLGAGNLQGNALNSAISFIARHKITNIVSDTLGGSNILASSFFAVIIAPVFEEIFFRKLIAGKLSVYGDKVAIVTSALLFGLYHGNFSQFFYAFLLGLALGYIYLNSGKIKYTIAVHMTINLFGTFTLLTQKAGTIAAGLFAIFELGIMVTGLVLFINYRKCIVLNGSENEPLKWGKAAFLNYGMMLFLIASAVIFGLNTYSVLK